VSVPILAVWGGRDHNVPVEESRMALAEVVRQSGNRSATLIVIPNANHDLAPTGLGRVIMLMDRVARRIPYYTPSMTLMAEWIATTTRAR
jgi:alpha-beta hydrolase superfamily lysophospholipase